MQKLPTRFPNKKIMAVDIGGTLTKVAFFLPSGSDSATNREELERLETITSDCIPSKSNSFIYFLLMFSVELANGDRIFLRKFHSSKVDEFLDWAKTNDLVGDQIHATGGGAYKYAD
jgi:pantothenate kinase